MLEKFPWLLNTWIDHEGNTLLGLCIIHDYPHFKSLMFIPIVQKHIDVESMDGLTPLMLAGDHPLLSDMMGELLTFGKANANYVNRHRESVFHRMAASNNFRGLALFRDFPKSDIIELRRKGDGATALMIALSRENMDVAHVLMCSFGAKATTKFGNSQSL